MDENHLKLINSIVALCRIMSHCSVSKKNFHESIESIESIAQVSLRQAAQDAEFTRKLQEIESDLVKKP